MELSYVSTDEMIADGLTKSPAHVKFHGLVQQIQISPTVTN